MATLTIALSDDDAEFARAQARRDGYRSVDDYFGDLLSRARLREAKRAFEAKIQEGLDSGELEPMTRDDWEAIEREGLRRLEAERQAR